MNRKELIESISLKTGLTKKDAERALQAFLESVEETLMDGNKVSLVGFGTFESRERSARNGRNPRTGETIHIPATRVPVFKAGKKLKEIVAESL